MFFFLYIQLFKHFIFIYKINLSKFYKFEQEYSEKISFKTMFFYSKLFFILGQASFALQLLCIIETSVIVHCRFLQMK